MSEETNGSLETEDAKKPKRSSVKELEIELRKQREMFEEQIDDIRVDLISQIDVLEAKIEASSVDREIREINQEVKGLDSKIKFIESSSEAHKVRADMVELEKQLDTISDALVCVLLTQCRGLGEMGWEMVLKRYWKTTGGVVFPEDKTALKSVLDGNETLNVIRRFLEFSFDK